MLLPLPPNLLLCNCFKYIISCFVHKYENLTAFQALIWIDLFHSSLQKDLGPDVCQAIWNAAGSNLKVPLELKVDITSGTNKVFTPEPAGQTKIDSSPVFTKFEGNSGPYQNNNLRELR